MGSALRRGGLISIGLAGVLVALAAQGASGNFVVPGSQAAGLKSCVEPTDFMRRNHMEVIRHQRDATVHQGIRSTKHSLKDCVGCHVSKGSEQSFSPVNGINQFCGACHAFAAVDLDCFQCHATVPDGKGWGAAAKEGSAAGAWAIPAGSPPGGGR
jgi:predicted CXXCH cytochrome family protein